jgi:hypothetical protein
LESLSARTAWLKGDGDRGHLRVHRGHTIHAAAGVGDRAFIVTPGHLRAWRSIYVDGMGWDEIDGCINFGMYDVVALLDFGLGVIDDIDVLEFFDFAQTPVDVVPADLDGFKERVAELLATG